MELQKFRKLNIDLPREPIADERPWMFAGWLLAIIVVIIISVSYAAHKKHVETVPLIFKPH